MRYLGVCLMCVMSCEVEGLQGWSAGVNPGWVTDEPRVFTTSLVSSFVRVSSILGDALPLLEATFVGGSKGTSCVQEAIDSFDALVTDRGCSYTSK